MLMKIIDDRLTPNMLMPANIGDAGIDLYACIPNAVRIFPTEVLKIPTGIKTAIPKGYVGLMFPRSGSGSKGLHLANVVGVIDSVYRGEILMKMTNNGDDSRLMQVNPLDRIAQLVVVPHFDYSKMVFTNDELPESNRGENGFGSTGD